MITPRDARRTDVTRQLAIFSLEGRVALVVGGGGAIGSALAVALAGGYTYRAQKDGLSIIRYGDPQPKQWAAGETMPVGPGDIIYVPERWF